MIVAWHIDVGLRDVTCIIERILQNYKLVGLWRLVLAFRRFPPMLVLFGTCEKKIVVGGSRRVHSSPRLTLCLAPCKKMKNKKKVKYTKFK